MELSGYPFILYSGLPLDQSLFFAWAMAVWDALKTIARPLWLAVDEGLKRSRYKELLRELLLVSDSLDLNRCALAPGAFRHTGSDALRFNV